MEEPEQEGMELLNCVARDFAVEGLGRDTRSDCLIRDSCWFLMGMRYLVGARTEFRENGAWDLAFPW